MAAVDARVLVGEQPDHQGILAGHADAVQRRVVGHAELDLARLRQLLGVLAVPQLPLALSPFHMLAEINFLFTVKNFLMIIIVYLLLILFINNKKFSVNLHKG